MSPFKYGNLTSIGALLSEVSESTCAQPLLPHYHSVTVLLQVTEKIFFLSDFFSDAFMVGYLLFCFTLPSYRIKKKKKVRLVI